MPTRRCLRTSFAALASSLLAAEYLPIRLARRSSPPCTRRSLTEPSAKMNDPVADERRIVVQKPDLWTFTQRNVPLWDLLDFFPPDSIGPRGPGDEPRPYEVKPITIETDLDF